MIRFSGVSSLLTAALLAVLSHQVSATEIIGHRGASFDAPENTLASVNLAWKQNADAVEIDIYLSKDDHIVLMHDKTPKRYGGPDTKVSEMTWDEIQKLDVGAWKDARFAGERVPEFADVLKTIPEGRRLFIEIKAGSEIVPHLVKTLKAANRQPSQTCIICFNAKVIEATVKALPELQHYWLASMDSGKDKQAPSAESLIQTTKETGASGIDIGGKTDRIDEALISQLTKAGIPVYVWTVNDLKEAERLAKLGVKGITTDKPGILQEAGIGDIANEP